MEPGPPPTGVPRIIPRFPEIGSTYRADLYASGRTRAESSQAFNTAVATIRVLRAGGLVFNEQLTPTVVILYGAYVYPFGTDFYVSEFGRWEAFWIASNQFGSGLVYAPTVFEEDFEPNPNVTSDQDYPVATPEEAVWVCDSPDPPSECWNNPPPTTRKIPPVWYPSPSDGPFFLLPGYTSMPSRRTMRNIARQQSNAALDQQSQFLSRVYNRDIDLSNSSSLTNSGYPSHALALATSLTNDAYNADQYGSNDPQDISWTELLGDMRSYYNDQSGYSARSAAPVHVGAEGADIHTQEKTAVASTLGHDQIRVFPNPTFGSINISTNANDQKPSEIHIYDVSGREVHSVVSTTSPYKWDGVLNDRNLAPSGIYIVTVSLDGAKSTHRFTIVR